MSTFLLLYFDIIKHSFFALTKLTNIMCLDFTSKHYFFAFQNALDIRLSIKEKFNNISVTIYTGNQMNIKFSYKLYVFDINCKF